MVNLTPIISNDKQVIQSYGKDGFKISDKFYSSNIIVFPDLVVNWEIAEAIEDLEISFFSQIIGAEDIELLLFGSGKKTIFLNKDIILDLKDFGIAVECMDTGAACRTYNMLLAEGRKVAAALYKLYS